MDTDRPIIVHYDGLTKTQTEREMTDEELAAYEAEQAEASSLPDTLSDPS